MTIMQMRTSRQIGRIQGMTTNDGEKQRSWWLILRLGGAISPVEEKLRKAAVVQCQSHWQAADC
jgi:hypothetical protein